MGFLGTYLEYKITVISEKKNLFQHPLKERQILFNLSFKMVNPRKIYSINPGLCTIALSQDPAGLGAPFRKPCLSGIAPAMLCHFSNPKI